MPSRTTLRLEQWVHEWQAGQKGWTNISETGRPLYRIAPGIVAKVYRAQWPQQQHRLLQIGRPVHEPNSILREFEIQLRASRQGLAVAPLALIRRGRDALFIMREAPRDGQAVTTWLVTNHGNEAVMAQLRQAIGISIGQLHDMRTLHGDLHAANMWYQPAQRRVLLLDFEWSWSDVPLAWEPHMRAADATIMREMRHWGTRHAWFDDALFHRVLGHGGTLISQSSLDHFFAHWARRISQRTIHNHQYIHAVSVVSNADDDVQAWVPRTHSAALTRQVQVCATPSADLLQSVHRAWVPVSSIIVLLLAVVTVVMIGCAWHAKMRR